MLPEAREAGQVATVGTSPPKTPPVTPRAQIDQKSPFQPLPDAFPPIFSPFYEFTPLMFSTITGKVENMEGVN